MQQLKGVSISQGLAVGKIVVLTSAAAPEAQAGTPEEELARFQRAQQQAVRDLGALYEKARAELGEAEAEIFSVHQLMAEDEDFTDLIAAAIAGGAEASEAVRQAGEQCAAMFSSMDDAYMRERAADVQDVAARIRRILRGEAETTLTGPCLIAAEELTPSQTVQFPRAFVQGFSDGAGRGQLAYRHSRAHAGRPGGVAAAGGRAAAGADGNFERGRGHTDPRPG